jgi:hypothetical protein
MENLRRARRLARLWLAWFALSLGVAMAAPAVQPQRLEPVCSAAGTVKLVVAGDPEGAVGAHGHHHDCGQCLLAVPPPAAASIAVHPLPAAAPVVAHADPVRPRSASPFAARAPPRA